MSTTFPDSPALLDSTGRVIVQKLQGIINALGGGGGTVIIEEYDSSVLRYPNTNEDGGLTYKVGDYCSYNNSIYFCNTPINWNATTPPAFDSTKWYDATDDIVTELSKKPGIVITSVNGTGSPDFIELFGITGTHTIYNSGHGFSHVEGQNNTLGVSDDSSKSAFCSHVEGSNNVAGGSFTHVEGWGCKSLAYGCHTEGSSSEATGNTSHAEGGSTKAIGSYSHSEGYSTQAKGDYSHSEGSYNYAEGDNSHVEGNNNYAYGNYAHVEGYYNKTGKSEEPKSYSYGYASHAEGYQCTADGEYAHAEGYSCHAGSSSSVIYAPHAEGYYCTVDAPYSHVEGYSCTCHASHSHVEGQYNQANGAYNHVEGANMTVYGGYNHAEGQSNTFDSTTQPSYCHVEGYSNRVMGYNGSYTQYCHAEGNNNNIYGSRNSHAEGYSNYIYAADCSHVEGQNNYANAYASHAGGYNSYAGKYGRTDARASFAHGDFVIVSNPREAGFGIYNNSKDGREDIYNYDNTYTSYTTGDQVRYEGIIYTALEDIEAPAGSFDSTKWDAGETPVTYATNPTLFSVGNGNGNYSRSNAFEVLKDGTGYLKNDKRIITTEEVPDPPSTDGTYTLQVVVNDGQLTYSWV